MYKILLLLIIPTYLLSGGYLFFNFTYVFPLALVLISLIALNRQVPKGHLAIFSFPPVSISFFYILAFLAIGTAPFVATAFAYQEAAHIIIGLIVILLMINLIDRKSRLMAAVAISKIVVVIVCIDYLAIYFGGGEVEYLYSNVNRMTTLLVFILPFILANMISKLDFVDLLVFFLIVLVTVLAESRLNLIAILVQTAILSIFIVNRIRGNVKVLIKVMLVPIITLMLVPLALVIITADQDKSIQDQYEQKYTSMGRRLHMIAVGWSEARDSWFLGVGAGNVQAKGDLAGVYADNEIIERGLSLHNFFLQLLATYGAVGLLAFGLLYLRLLKYAFSKDVLTNQDTPFYSYYKRALIMFLVTFPLICNTPSYLFDFRPFYFIFALHFCFLSVLFGRKNYVFKWG